MLMGDAICVLLIACLNVASLELASAMARRRTFAIHAALGSRCHRSIDRASRSRRDALQPAVGDVRLAASVTTGFGVLAFVVAVAGIYGVMMFLVTGRTREIGVRIALGAQPADIRRIFLQSSVRLVLAGGVLGVAAAALMSRTMQSMLFGVTPSDPTTFITVLSAVAVTALGATWFPARQAARVDPVVALRTE
jgi:putative ABC transport system permease protein